MYKIPFSMVISFILIALESFIVMSFKHQSSIDFENIHVFVDIWSMNFFFVYTVLSHIELWVLSKNKNVLDE